MIFCDFINRYFMAWWNGLFFDFDFDFVDSLFSVRLHQMSSFEEHSSHRRQTTSISRYFKKTETNIMMTFWFVIRRLAILH